jgi:hypothetical protein
MRSKNPQFTLPDVIYVVDKNEKGINFENIDNNMFFEKINLDKKRTSDNVIITNIENL